MTPLLPVDEKIRKRKFRKDLNRSEIFDATSEPRETEKSIEPLVDLIPTISSQSLDDDDVDDVDALYRWQQFQDQQEQEMYSGSEEVELRVSYLWNST